MGFLHTSNELLRPLDTLKRSELVGYVVKVQIPDENGNITQRVVIRCPHLHRGIPDADLPYCMPKQGGQANAGAGTGTYRVPPVGAKVMVSFDNDDPHMPQYTNSPTTKDVAGQNEIAQEGPNAYGEIDQAGNKWKVNTETGIAEYIHNSGTTINIAKDGSVVIASPKKVTISSSSSMNIVAKEDLTISAGQNLKILSGQDMTLGAGQKGSFIAGADMLVTGKGSAIFAGATAKLSGQSSVDVATGGHYQLAGSSISSSTIIPVGGSSSPESPGGPDGPESDTTTTARTRPTIDQRQNAISV